MYVCMYVCVYLYKEPSPTLFLYQPFVNKRVRGYKNYVHLALLLSNPYAEVH